MQKTLILMTTSIEFLIHHELTLAKIPVNGTTVYPLIDKCLFGDEFRKMMLAGHITEDDITSHIIETRPARTDPLALVEMDDDGSEKLFQLVTSLFFYPMDIYYNTFDIMTLGYPNPSGARVPNTV
jgi:hypothetical protein